MTAPPILLCLCAALCLGEASAGALTRIDQIRTMDDRTRSRNPAVLFRGVVTLHDPRSGLTCLQDQSGGIELPRLPPGSPALQRGMEIEVAAKVDGSRPYPGIDMAGGSIRVIGPAQLPAAQPFDAGARFSGDLDGLLCQLEAVVFSMDVSRERGGRPWLRLNVATSHGHLSWLLPWDETTSPPAHWLHAKVRVKAVSEPIINQLGQRVGILLLVHSSADIEVIKPPAADPFDRPTRSLAELLRPGLQPHHERVRIEGTVLDLRKKQHYPAIFLRCDQGAIKVEYDGKDDFAPGDRVAVVGYPALGDKSVAILESVVRRLGTGPAPLPVDVEVSRLLRAGGAGELVRIRGRVLRNGSAMAGGGVIVESSDKMVEVLLPENLAPAARAALIKLLEPGASVALSGIAVLRGTMSIEGGVEMTDMQLLMRSPRDATVLARPPWWNTGRLLALAGALAAVLALSSLWVLLLRRRVSAQTSIIREKIAHEARWLERSRIARDIHDDVGSALTQITLLGELGRRDCHDEKGADEHFRRISRQARDAVRALDAIVWTVNPKNDSLAVTVSYLCRTVEDMARDAAIRCRLEIPDELPELMLGAKLRHNLLLAVKEAVHNVIKHANAGVLRLRLECGSSQLRLEIIDDGRGFDQAGASKHRTGLDSMRRRMEESGGSCEIGDIEGHGTCVAFILPSTVLG